MAKLKPDLQEIYNRGDKIDTELNRIEEEAIEKRISHVESIPGKGSGQLKEKNTAFFEPGTNMQVVSSPGKRR